MSSRKGTHFPNMRIRSACGSQHDGLGTWRGLSAISRRSIISTRGTTKDSVLPDPVHASASTSRKVRKSGMAAACTGVMVEKPRALRARCEVGLSSRSSKFFGAVAISRLLSPADDQSFA